MMPRTLALAALVVLGGVAVVSSAPQRRQAQTPPDPSGVSIRHVPAAKQYVVNIQGKHFTNYAYGEAFWHKPVFYPVMSPNGTRVNREYPMVAGLPGETADHPHHTSLFFTYDEVNGNNFWAASGGGKGPRIEHTGARVEGATLIADLLWKGADGQVIFEETRRVTFGGDADRFWMDHAITLRAPQVAVTMGDTKEGAFGLRVHDALRESKGGSGRYINAEGAEAEAGVWGKPSPWVALRGTVPDAGGPKDVTVAIFAHPKAHNSPPYWHARGYGLFAVNPFGRRGYDPKAPERVTRVGVGEQLALRFLVAVYSGKVEKARLDQDYAAFSR